MRESRFELSVGDSVRMDDQILTVIDIIGDEIIFGVESVDAADAAHKIDPLESVLVEFAEAGDKRRPPR